MQIVNQFGDVEQEPEENLEGCKMQEQKEWIKINERK
jgi:hypothetical protein